MSVLPPPPRGKVGLACMENSRSFPTQCCRSLIFIGGSYVGFSATLLGASPHHPHWVHFCTKRQT